MKRDDGSIFVFGSNLAGRHGKGAALEALHKHGAVYGIGVGRMGHSYAIPTKDENLKTLPITVIARHVADFISYARKLPGVEFYVTAIGTGLAGYNHAEIAPLFRDAPENCILPDAWITILRRRRMTNETH